MIGPMPEEEIRRVVGLHPNREKCWVECEAKTKFRKPCRCYPGYSMASAVRVVRAMEAYYEDKRKGIKP